jgi:hypothetical protein
VRELCSVTYISVLGVAICLVRHPNRQHLLRVLSVR